MPPDSVNLTIGQILVVPRGTPDLAPLKFDLTEINHAEKRKAELSYVNKETAPDLMQIFNRAYCEVLRMMAQISFEFGQATKYANKRRSIVILDVAPEMLTRKGLASKKSPAGSEDLRRAVLEQDEEYLQLTDKTQSLKAFHEYLKSKAKGFEMAYYTAKKIFDVANGTLGAHHELRGGIDENLGAGETEGAIGEPRFDYKG
jgi:hypothetical protein